MGSGSLDTIGDCWQAYFSMVWKPDVREARVKAFLTSGLIMARYPERYLRGSLRRNTLFYVQ